MGLSNFPSPSDGMLPMIVMNTVMSVALVKNKIRSVLGGGGGDHDSEDEYYSGEGERSRRVSITRYGSLCRCMRRSGREPVECCVCLSGFEAEEEVSELSCKHFFHKGCLDKWFDNQTVSSCPLCRSVM